MKIKILLIALLFYICQNSFSQGEPYAKINLPKYKPHPTTRTQKQELLDNLRKEVKFISRGVLIARSKHFEVRITKLSMDDLGLKRDKDLEYLILKVLYILEEAYGRVGKDFDYFPSGKIGLVELYSRRRYNLEEMGKKSGGMASSNLEVRIPLDGRSALDHLTGRFLDILYHEYTHVVLFAVRPGIGNTVIHETLAEFEAAKALVTSSWTNDFKEEEASQVVCEFNRLNKHIIEKYGRFFAKDYGKEMKKIFQKCKWCNKAADITGEKRNIRCPHCKMIIKIESKKD